MVLKVKQETTMRVLLLLTLIKSAEMFVLSPKYSTSAFSRASDMALRSALTRPTRAPEFIRSFRAEKFILCASIDNAVEATEAPRPLIPETFYSFRQSEKDLGEDQSPIVVEMEREEGDRAERSAQRSTRTYIVHGADAVSVQTTDPSETGVGYTVCNSAIALASMLTDSDSKWYEDLNGKNILELGSGPGLTGISIAKAFPQANVHLTDYNPSVIRTLQQVAEENSLPNVEAWELDWNKFLEPGWNLPVDKRDFDLVVAADCVYHHIPSAFTATALRLCEENPALRFLMMSQSDRVGVPLVVDRLAEIPDRVVTSTDFTFSEFKTPFQPEEFPATLPESQQEFSLTCLEIVGME